LRRYLHRSDLRPEKEWAVIEWLASRGAGEFTVALMGMEGSSVPTLDRIEAALRPHELGNEMRARISSYGEDGFRGSTKLWALTSDTLQILHECFPNGPFAAPTYDEGGWFEDLELYREKELVFGAVSHEGEAVLQLGHAEWPLFASLGIPTRERGQYI
jgi:hypothetical protein